MKRKMFFFSECLPNCFKKSVSLDSCSCGMQYAAASTLHVLLKSEIWDSGYGIIAIFRFFSCRIA